MIKQGRPNGLPCFVCEEALQDVSLTKKLTGSRLNDKEANMREER
jgi:hypothetical protein